MILDETKKVKYLDVNIILLDDDTEHRALVALNLQRASEWLKNKVTIFECSNAEEAWKIWKKYKIHAVVTDVYLGNTITGIDFLHEIKKDIPNGRIPCIILTGIVDHFNLDRFWDEAQVVSKPIEPYFWKKCRVWLSHINSFWKGLKYEFPELEIEGLERDVKRNPDA